MIPSGRSKTGRRTPTHPAQECGPLRTSQDRQAQTQRIANTLDARGDRDSTATSLAPAEGIMDRLTATPNGLDTCARVVPVRPARQFDSGDSHGVFETIFWFHPLVWLIRTRFDPKNRARLDDEYCG